MEQITADDLAGLIVLTSVCVCVILYFIAWLRE
jgi:hypothetical protein